MINSLLEQLGWKPDEAAVYTTLLQLGTQPASIVARQIKKKRTTVRVYLEKLIQSGFVDFHWKGRTQYFNAKTPQDAVHTLENNKKNIIRKLDNNIRAFSTFLPQLTALIGMNTNMPKITYHEGAQHLKKMYTDSLNSKTEILCFSSVQDLWDLFGKKYDKWYVQKRVKNKIPLRYIAPDTLVEKQESKKDKKYLRESRHLPESIFKITNEILIYDAKVAFITLKNEKIGVLIDNKEIYQSMKILFEALWLTTIY